MRRQVLADSKVFKLIKHKKEHRKWYEVEYHGWWNYDVESIRDFFDPQRSKSGRHGTAWKFSNRKDAEQMYLTAVLRWI